MRVAKLYRAKDIRIETMDAPSAPKAGEVLLTIGTVGLCGSDLHMYETGRTGYTDSVEPFVLGHEFMGGVTAIGDGALDGNHNPITIGQRMAVDPCVPCWRCEQCEQGHPNLCPNHSFYGLFPDHGALREQMIVEARNCFPMPDELGDETGPLLETLGIAIHAIDLSKIKIASSVAIIGAGPVGLLITKLASMMGVSKLFTFDKLAWRVDKAREWGATHAYNVTDYDPVDVVMDVTNGRGVDVAIEAAFADDTVQQAADMLRYGGRLVLVGIPPDDQLNLKHSVARRMKHTYPRAIELATSGKVNLEELISHKYDLSQTAEAYAKNFAYDEGIHKVILTIGK